MSGKTMAASKEEITASIAFVLLGRLPPCPVNLESSFRPSGLYSSVMV